MKSLDQYVNEESQRVCDEYDLLKRCGSVLSTRVSELIAITSDPILKATLIGLGTLYQCGKSTEAFLAVAHCFDDQMVVPHEDRPTSVRELVPYLLQRPNVRVTFTPGAAFGIATDVRELRCVAASTTRLDWSDGRFLPLDCRKTPKAEASETGIEFDDAGFSVFKFGAKVRVDYID